MRYARWITALAVAATIVAPRQARAQEASVTAGPARVAIEGFLAQYFLDNPTASGTEGLGGVGVRAMVARNVAANAGPVSFFGRARGGIFLAFTTEQKDISTIHYGAQGEIPFFGAPVVSGYLDPFVSLGIGAFRTKVDSPVAGLDLTATDLALTPGVGTLVPLTGAIAFRGDIRDVIIFGDRTSNNFVFEGGISVGF